MRNSTGNHIKVYRNDDPVTGIGYKIIYNKPCDRYEIYTQYQICKGEKPLRNKIVLPEVKRREHDSNGLIDYLDNYIIKNHLRFYRGREYIKNPCVTGGIIEKEKVIENKSQSSLSKLLSNSKPIKVNVPADLSQGEKTKQLDRLFDDWKKAQEEEPEEHWRITNGGNANITRKHFRSDGIIDEATFNREERKVLFISTEANDNDYSAKTELYPSSVKDYREYHETRTEVYRGRMKEKLAELYKTITRRERNSLPNPDAVMHFAFMDINKRGGGNKVRSWDSIEAYCSYYREYIRREIEIISPDVVVIVGMGLYDKKYHMKYLGAVQVNGKPYFKLENKNVPILGVYHTAFRFNTEKALEGYEDDLRSGVNAAKCLEEMRRFEL